MIINIPKYNGIGVYKLTNTVTGRVYIGSSLNCYMRLKQHSKYPQNKKMEADAELGPYIAEIVHTFPNGCNNRELADAERYYCTLYEADTEKGYNDPIHSSVMHNRRRGAIDDFVFSLELPKGSKAIIQEHAKSRGESTNEFINRAIDEAMERDTAEKEDE